MEMEVTKSMKQESSGFSHERFNTAKQMLMESHVCIVRDKAPKVKDVIKELEELTISFEVSPKFKY